MSQKATTQNENELTQRGKPNNGRMSKIKRKAKKKKESAMRHYGQIHSNEKLIKQQKNKKMRKCKKKMKKL